MQGNLLELILMGPSMMCTKEELATVTQRDAHIGLCATTITTVRRCEDMVLNRRGAHDNLLHMNHRVTV